jgi:DNA topoisomerase-2
MYLFNSKGTITKYSTVDDILLEFYNTRLAFYKIRKEHYIKILLNELIILKEKKRFIEHVIQKIIVINERTEDDIIADLHKYNFKQLSHNVNSETQTYSYLTGMSLWSLTKNKIAELDKECNKKQSEYDIYTSKKLHDIWKDEMKQFMEQYDVFIKEYSIPETKIKKKIAPKTKKNNISITDKPRKNSFE